MWRTTEGNEKTVTHIQHKELGTSGSSVLYMGNCRKAKILEEIVNFENEGNAEVIKPDDAEVFSSSKILYCVNLVPSVMRWESAHFLKYILFLRKKDN